MKAITNDIKKKIRKFDKPDTNVSREFQFYGYELAKKLSDLKHKALYIKLAKEEPRDLLEKAYRFAIDYREAKSKAKLFMFKLKELKEARFTREIK